MLRMGINKTIDSILFIGYHGMSGKQKSFCAHTNSLQYIKELRINGIAFSEAMINALIAKYYDAKVLFISGTDIAISELKNVIPSIYSQTNLISLDFYNAKSHPSEETLRESKQVIQKSLQCKDHIDFIPYPTTNLDFCIMTKKPFPLKKYENMAIDVNNTCLKYKAANIIEGHAIYRKIIKVFKTYN